MSGLELSFLDTNKLMSKDVYDQDESGVTDYAEKITGVDEAPDNTFYGKKAGSIGFHAIEVGSGGAASLNELSDVTITTPAINQVLKYNGSTFVNSVIAYGDVSGTPTLSPVATSGDYDSLTNKPNIPTSISDLSDVSTSGIVSGQVLQWNGSSFVPATVSGGGGSGASSLAELSDVDTTGASNGDVLAYNGTNWLPQAISGGTGGGGAKIEWVKLNYTAGGLALGAVGTSEALEWSSGITNAIVLSNNSNGDLILEIEPNYNFPAATYMIYGYDAPNNRYEMRPMTVKPSMQYLYPGVGHTTANPTTFGAFTKFRMSCTTSESGAAPKTGLPAILAHAYIFMVYYQ